MARPKHTNKEIEAVVAQAESAGWTVIKGSGHCWGRLLCPRHDRDGCQLSIFSTPSNPFHHAKRLARVIAKCAHCREETDDDPV